MDDEMIQDEKQPPKTVQIDGDNSPVSITTVNVNQRDTLGVIFLGLLSFFLFVALLRSQARNRKLMEQLAGLMQS